MTAHLAILGAKPVETKGNVMTVVSSLSAGWLSAKPRRCARLSAESAAAE
jgi:hypothetical protein